MAKKREWKRWANGCVYAAKRLDDDAILPWTCNPVRRNAVALLRDQYLGADLYETQKHRFKIVRVIITEVPRG